MSDKRRFGHDTSPYERPHQPFRCGRSALWKKSCWQGPGLGGQCGGEFECAPVRIGDRWECRRPKLAGGRCDEGPRPDGSCAQHRHPPCVPRRNNRQARVFVSVVAALALIILLIVGINPTTPSVVGAGAIDAGNLTSVHAGFTREQGCAACHTSHKQEAGSWLLAAFRSNDTSERCVDCHDFAGPVMLAHNQEHPKRPGLGTVSCASCHSEHRGGAAAIAQVPDFKCANCHERSFDNFVGNHPPFPENYPYTRSGTIFFDHSKHIKDYFTNPKHTKAAGRDAKFAEAAKTKCTACHAVENATREVKPKPYAQICANCHDSQIAKRELVLFEPQRMTAAASVLLGLEKEGDEAETGKRLNRLWSTMANNGTDALTELIPAAVAIPAPAPMPAADAVHQPAPAVPPTGLLSGLSSQMAREAGAAWAGGRSATQGKPDAPGWALGENSEGNPSLFYRPAGHADPVLKAWIETLRSGLQDKDAGKRALTKEAMNELLDSQTGPGACGKCHSAALRAPPSAEHPGAKWSYTGSDMRPLTRYKHTPHLGLMDPDAGCTNCHQMNKTSKYAKYFTSKASANASYESNFSGIRKETCVECHSEGRVNAACQVCHSYHLPHKFNLGFRQKSSPAK